MKSNQIQIHEKPESSPQREHLGFPKTLDEADLRCAALVRVSQLGLNNLSAMLSRLDSGARGRFVQKLQQDYGNRYLCSLALTSTQPGKDTGTSSRQQPEGCSKNRIQRQSHPASAPASVDPVKEQWEIDWNDPDFTSTRKYFKINERPPGTPKYRYDFLCPLYQEHGITRPLKYIKDNIKPTSFFGLSTMAHTNLKAALAKAETTLKKSGVTTAPVKGVYSFTARTTSEYKWSNHASGKAIDFDPDTNPHWTDDLWRERAVITAVSGYDIEKANPGDTRRMDSYDANKAASANFMANYNAPGMKKRIDELKAEEILCQAALLQIENELNTIVKADSARKKEIEGRKKQKEAELKATRKKRDLLEKELTKYNELDTTIDTLSGEIEKLQQTIDLLEAGIDPEVDNPDPKVVQKKLQAKKQALKNATNKLTQKTKERDSDLLRRFAKSGFLTLPKILVEAMKTAGFTWGGDWSPDKDFMHFDLR